MTQIKHLSLFSIILLGVALIAEPSFAAGTLGGVINNTIHSFRDTPGLLAALSHIMGGILGVWGIFKTIEHVNNSAQVTIWEPAKKFLAGGAFLTVPTVVNAARNTVDRGNLTAANTDVSFGTTSGGGLDAMLVKLMADIYQPGLNIVSAFAYLFGLILVVISISRFLKSEQEGAKGPTGIGTTMTIITAGIMLSFDKIVGAVSSSLFGTANIKSKGTLVYDVGLGNSKEHIEAVIAAVIAFVIFLGTISIVRGFIIMRNVAEGGQQQASPMAGMTHILGGGLAVNLGPLINAVQQTLGITSYGISFG